jgi:Sulfotransferase domain
MNKTPDFIIIGAMKCATSTLHEQLAMQPGIFMTDLKEPNFFSDDEQYDRGLDWYLSHFESAPLTAMCGESSTHYTKLPTYPQTIERLHKHFPNVKSIYILRHPIDRLMSQYVHEWTMRVISIDIDRALDLHPELIAYSQYAMQLQPYLETFGSERVLPVFFERLIRQPQSELERICNFLGYSGQPVWQDDLDAQNVSSERMRKHELRDFLLDIPLLKALRQKLVPKSTRDWIRGLWTLKEKPQLSAERIAQLQAIFDEDLAKLTPWLGMELSCDRWKAICQSNTQDLERRSPSPISSS